MIICPACKIEYMKGQKYCGQCGASLIKLLLDIDEGMVKKDVEEEGEEILMVCSSCGYSHKKVLNFCTYCGTKLESGAVTQDTKAVKETITKTVEVKVICPYCHVENAAGTNICKNCGIDLIEEAKIEEKPMKKVDAIESDEGKPEVIKKEEKAEEIKKVDEKKAKEDDTASLIEDTLIKCPNCNFEQMIGGEACVKCGKSLIIREISSDDVRLEEKKSTIETKVIGAQIPSVKTSKPTTKEFEKKLTEKIKADTSSVPTPPVKPTRPVSKPKVDKIEKEIVTPIKIKKEIPLKRIDIKDKIASVILSKVFVIGLVAIILIIGAIILVPRLMKGGGEKQVVETVTLPLYIEGVENDNLPVVMKGFGEFFLKTSVTVKVYIDNKFYGYTPLEGIILLAGFHDLRLVNEEYSIDDKRQIYIENGIPLEQELALGHFGSISINAVPWADVYVDEKYVGQTPIANLRLVAGTHEIKFINPKYPIKRRSVEIIEGSNISISVEMKYSNY